MSVRPLAPLLVPLPGGRPTHPPVDETGDGAVGDPGLAWSGSGMASPTGALGVQP